MNGLSCGKEIERPYIFLVLDAYIVGDLPHGLEYFNPIYSPRIPIGSLYYRKGFLHSLRERIYRVPRSPYQDNRKLELSAELLKIFRRICFKVFVFRYRIFWKKNNLPGTNVTNLRLNLLRKSILLPKQTHPGCFAATPLKRGI